jgi:peptidoglycan-associated lipoprotein
MTTNKLTNLMAIGLVLTFVVTGCKHKPPQTTPIPDYSKGRVGDPTTGLPPSQPFNPNEKPAVTDPAFTPQPTDIDPEKMNQLREILAAHTVHFDLDSTVIKSGERPHVQAVADYLKGAPGDALLVEGHCDERGTEEYNRALGERRALALREALIAGGADGQKIVTRSYGKDRKVDTGNSEAAHAKNRRGEFVVLRPK